MVIVIEVSRWWAGRWGGREGVVVVRARGFEKTYEQPRLQGTWRLPQCLAPSTSWRLLHGHEYDGRTAVVSYDR